MKHVGRKVAPIMGNTSKLHQHYTKYLILIVLSIEGVPLRFSPLGEDLFIRTQSILRVCNRRLLRDFLRGLSESGENYSWEPLKSSISAYIIQ